MSVQDKNYEKKYLKYKQKYADLKEMEAGAGFSMFGKSASASPSSSSNVFQLANMSNFKPTGNLFGNSTPEQLVIANRQKYQDSKLALNKATNNLEDAKLKENYANKAYNKDKNNANLSKLNAAENTRKVAETAVSSAKRNIEFAKGEYKKSKEVARKLKLSNAEKAVTEAQNKLNSAQKELENVQREEQDRLSKKAFKNSSSDSSRSSSPKLLTDGSVDDE
jgi:hypothetical protein